MKFHFAFLKKLTLQKHKLGKGQSDNFFSFFFITIRIFSIQNLNSFLAEFEFDLAKVNKIIGIKSVNCKVQLGTYQNKALKLNE